MRTTLTASSLSTILNRCGEAFFVHGRDLVFFCTYLTINKEHTIIWISAQLGFTKGTLTMNRKEYNTDRGKIVYWISDNLHQENNKQTLVFLPGLLAEHNLFNEQIAYFELEFNCFTWDAPAHAESRPYTADFTISELAEVLHMILEYENICRPIIIGQSFGACIGQMFMELYHNSLSGYISMNSVPIQRRYYSYFDLLSLQSTNNLYYFTPYLKNVIIWQCSNTYRGRKNMEHALKFYTDSELRKLIWNGFISLYYAICADLQYIIDCPALLICGKQDRSPIMVHYNKKWSEKTGIRVEWVENAGHNVNIDQPDQVNRLIYDFISRLKNNADYGST